MTINVMLHLWRNKMRILSYCLGFIVGMVAADYEFLSIEAFAVIIGGAVASVVIDAYIEHLKN